jgi:hypothetical protein
MLSGGDEFARTQQGNNNAYCQDNEITWFDWSIFFGPCPISRWRVYPDELQTDRGQEVGDCTQKHAIPLGDVGRQFVEGNQIRAHLLLCVAGPQAPARLEALAHPAFVLGDREPFDFLAVEFEI